MFRFILTLSTLLLFSLSLTAQFVTGVSFELRYNEDDCLHEVWLVIDSGSATSTIFRTQASAQMSIVAPAQCTMTIAERHNPRNANDQPNFWSISSIDYAPAIDSLHNYYGITPSLGSNSRYDALAPGTEVHLYDLSLTPSVSGPEGIRFYRNGIDPSSLDGLSGDFSNGFTIGTPLQLYNGNNTPIYPTVYAEVTGPKNIYEGYETQLSPTTDGTWASSDEDIATVTVDGTVTGHAAGVASLTFTPNMGCPTAAIVQVVDLGVPSSVGVGTNTPHPSAILDVNSNTKGLLIPRMSAMQRLSIVSPATGLIVYQNTGNNTGIYYYTGVEWRLLDSSPATNSLTGGTSPTSQTSLTTSQQSTTLAQTQHKQRKLEKIVEQQSQLIQELINDRR